jgi:hypothetical protein
MPQQPVAKTTPSSVDFYRADGWFNATKISKVFTNSVARNRFGGQNGFMEIKRKNPNTPFGASDKPFVPNGKYGTAVPGLRHAHITHDLSIVYKVEGNNIYLYGFYTHDDLGTGNPANKRKQDSMADRFRNATFTEE